MLARKVTQNIVYWLMAVFFFSVLSNYSLPFFASESTTDVSTEQQQNQSPRKLTSGRKIDKELKRHLDSTRGRLASLMSSEQIKELLLSQLQNELVNTEIEGDKEQLKQQIKKTRVEIGLIRDEFNLTLTGGIDEIKLITDVEETYNWRTDLEEIMKPIFRSLKGITEKPREIEGLRSKINFLKRNIELSESALAFIQQLNSGILPDSFLLRITTADTEWTNRLSSLKEELEIVQFQLQTRLEESSNFFNNFGETLLDFAGGRGFTIILAIFAFWSVWFLFSMVRRGYNYIIAKQKLKIESNLSSRVFYYSYQIFASLVAFTAMLLVFYVQGDWIMLGVSMLILATIFFSVKNYFPKFVVETKLLLNIGPVREGERVFYQDIPWLVEDIGVYTILFNPLLSGGRIRVQLKELVDMNSRAYDKSEYWFPCREGDMLLMPEGRLVKVELQTPEFVKLNYTGGATTTVRTVDFLAMSFTNLSEESFRVSSYFGVDYALQRKATNRVQSVFREEIQEYIESQNYGKYLKVLRVEFYEASDSALTFKIIADFHGIAARHHNIISRALQSAAVDTCNKQGWSIPFSQLTIHKAVEPSVSE